MDLEDHPLQYTLIKGLGYGVLPSVRGTENLTDRQVAEKLRSAQADRFDSDALWVLDHLDICLSDLKFDRYDRCPTCHQWSPCNAWLRARITDAADA